MTPKQTALYWREWGACSKARKALSLPVGDDARHALHRKALRSDVDVSMKQLSNQQLDKVLAIFRTFSKPSDLGAQMRAEDQPQERKDVAIERCYEVLDELEQYGKAFDGTGAKERYLNGTSWAVLRKPVDRLTDIEAWKLWGVLNRQLQRVQDKARRDEAENPQAADADQENPF